MLHSTRFFAHDPRFLSAIIPRFPRLLDGTETHPNSYALICDRDLTGTGAETLYRSIIWNAPELLLPCGDCHGCGEYVGLLERETCPTCGGRKMVPV
jgi:hypothetical protein